MLIKDAGLAGSVGDLFGAVSRRLRRLVSFDAAVWVATDPATSLPTAPTRSENMARLEPAKASEIAPIITQAYQLSARERQITQLISQGFGAAEIAARLELSTYTVRDHIKTVFEKVGVSSRGELVAKLFAEHYAPVHSDPAGHEQVELSRATEDPLRRA